MATRGVVGSLSVREFETLSLIAEGLSNHGIARRMGISQKTVETVCRAVFRKLDLVDSSVVNRRVQAALVFHDACAVLPSVPVPVASFVGRAHDVENLTRTLASGVVVTMLGAGGIGKSRLAVDVARILESLRSPRWVDLTPVRSIESAWTALFDVFGIQPPSTAAGQRRLVRHLITEPRLIVIDNAESMPQAAAALARFARSAGETAVLITSRVPLFVEGEVVVRLGPLTPPETIRLIKDRLADRGSGDLADTLTDEQLGDVSRRVDGMPLAVELLAVRMAQLGTDGLLDRLRSLPRYLETGGPGRHGGLAPALSASFDALSERTQRAFACLSAFVGGCTIAGARLLLAPEHVDVDRVIEDMLGQSLMARVGDRYRMLEPVRQYAASHLERLGLGDGADRALIAWAVDLSRGAAWGSWTDPATWRPRLTAEAPNIDAAIVNAQRLGDTDSLLRILAGLGPSWGTTRPETGLRYARTILAMADHREPDRRLGAALMSAGACASFAQEEHAAEEWLTQSLSIFVHHEDRHGEMLASFWLGRLLYDSSRLRRARVLADELDVPVLGEWIRALEAVTLVEHERLDEAMVAITDARAFSARHQRVPIGLISQAHALVLAIAGSDLANGARYARDAVVAFRADGDTWNEISALGTATLLATRRGHMAEVVELTALQLELADEFSVLPVIGLAACAAAAAAWRLGARSDAISLVENASQLLSAVPNNRLAKHVLHDLPELIAHVRIADIPLAADPTAIVERARELLHRVGDSVQPSAAYLMDPS